MLMIMRKFTVFVIACMCVCSVFGQNDTLTIDDYYIDFSVPDISALSMLGVENDEIVRPGNLKEFAAGIANFVDTDGSLKPAYAIEWSFLKTFTNTNTYKWNKRFYARNLALTAGSSNQDSLGTRLAVGFKWVPIDKSEPIGDSTYYKLLGIYASGYKSDRLKYSQIDENISEVFDYNIHNNPTEEKLKKVTIVSDILTNDPDTYKKDIIKRELENLQKFLIDSISNSFSDNNLEMSDDEKRLLEAVVNKYSLYVLSQLDGDYKDFKSYIKPIMSQIKDNYKKEHWNAFAFQLSGGWVANSEESNYNKLDTEKFSFFIGVSGPTFNKKDSKIKGQWLAQVKFEDDFTNNSYLEQGFSIGGRHLLGNSDNRWSVEVLYSNTSYMKKENTDISDLIFLRYTTGVEIKLTNGTWLELAFGGQKLFEGDESTSILTTFGFKHALQSKRRYDIK